jgi:hypothetical protein
MTYEEIVLTITRREDDDPIVDVRLRTMITEDVKIDVSVPVHPSQLAHHDSYLHVLSDLVQIAVDELLLYFHGHRLAPGEGVTLTGSDQTPTGRNTGGRFCVSSVTRT